MSRGVMLPLAPSSPGFDSQDDDLISIPSEGESIFSIKRSLVDFLALQIGKIEIAARRCVNRAPTRGAAEVFLGSPVV
jgi:hypothetical protein